MDFLHSGIPLGRVFGIQVRLHFTFLLYALYRVQQFENLLYGMAFIVGLYVCILLHEFGHALAARWADGEACDILLWPLGGLAYCRPAWHPTAHLICTVAGPLVTLLLFLGSWMAAPWVAVLGMSGTARFLYEMAVWNLWLLIFNLIPAFPMDGGRILRDTLWHWMSAKRATRIAVWTSRGIAALGILWAVVHQDYWLILLALFIWLQAQNEFALLASEVRVVREFSVLERLRRGRRKRAFSSVGTGRPAADGFAPFHRCASCGRTERDDPELEFRVCSRCSGGQEYCREHLETHRHI